MSQKQTLEKINIQEKTMPNVINTKSLNSVLVEVRGRSILDDIQSNFDVFSRPDLADEVIMDMTGIEDNGEQTSQLCDILGIDPESDQASEIVNGGYVVFYA